MSLSGDAPERFQQLFNALGRDTLHLVDAVYAPNISFRDPVHAIEGIADLRTYFARLYDGVESCQFDFHTVLRAPAGGEAMMAWTMHLRLLRFRRGETLHLPGASLIRYGDKVHLHHDFFDVGALLYERLPLLGGALRALKARL